MEPWLINHPDHAPKKQENLRLALLDGRKQAEEFAERGEEHDGELDSVWEHSRPGCGSSAARRRNWLLTASDPLRFKTHCMRGRKSPPRSRQLCVRAKPNNSAFY